MFFRCLPWILYITNFAGFGVAIGTRSVPPPFSHSRDNCRHFLATSEQSCSSFLRSTWIQGLEAQVTQNLSRALVKYAESQNAYVVRVSTAKYHFDKLKHLILHRRSDHVSALDISLHPFFSYIETESLSDYHGDILASLYRNTRFAFFLPEYRAQRFLDVHNTTTLVAFFLEGD